MTTKQDISGLMFGRLTALRLFSVGTKHSPEKWVCQCECGGIRNVQTRKLLTGGTKSCGCLHRETVAEVMRATKTQHGQARRGDGGISGAWKSWQSMLRRCTDPRRPEYERYGARGISVCAQWLTFEAFYADMGDRPEGTSIDRYPNKAGNYQPGNCRWATRKEQSRNQSRNLLVSHEGQTYPLSEWAERLGLNYGTLRSRYQRGERGAELFEPPQQTKARRIRAGQVISA